MDYFANIIGQNKIINTLKTSLATGKVSHAYLFCGPAGVGKMQVAMAFARSIIAQEDNQAELYFNQGFHPDLFIIERLENRNLIAKEQISREMGSWISLKPYRAKHRIVLIRDAHLMSIDAANTLLKPLEDPPAYAIIILVSDAENIIETIVSRCQVLRFIPVPQKQLEEHLIMRGFDNEKAVYAARLGQGSVACAISFAEEEGLQETWEIALGLIKSLVLGQKGAIFDAADIINHSPELIVKILQTILRDALIFDNNQGELLLPLELQDILGELKDKDKNKIMAAIMEIDRLKQYYRYNVNSKLLNTLIGYQLWEALH